MEGNVLYIVHLPLKQFTSCNNYVPVPSEMFSDWGSEEEMEDLEGSTWSTWP